MSLLPQIVSQLPLTQFPSEPATASAIKMLDSHELLEVHVFCRHGDRSPTPFGKAKSKTELWASRIQEVPAALQNREYFPQKFPWGLLTTKGAEQARNLGAWLRENYLTEFRKSNGELNLREAPESFVTVRTTNFLRTTLTAWFVLEGLLESPEAAGSIPFACRSTKDENLYHNEYCTRLLLKWDQAWAATERAVGDDGVNWRDHFQGMQAAMARELELALDNSVIRVSMDGAGFPWITAVDTLECERLHGDALPEGVLEENVTAVRSLLARDHAACYQDRDLLQLAIGRLVRELKEALLDRVHTPQASARRPSVHLYSGHDITIMPLSAALGLPWPEWPAYTASICVELWRSPGGDHCVRLLFDRKEVAVPISRVAGAPKKSVLSWEEFCEVTEWTSLDEAGFASKCQEVADITPTTPDRT